MVPDKERWTEAWRRLFGTEPPRVADADEVADEGDCFAYLVGDRIVELTCDGASIYCLDPEEAARLKANPPPRIFDAQDP